MSKHAPGSKDWWIETALITIGGIAVAVWLWPDPSTDPGDRPVGQTSETAESQNTLGVLLSRGCLTAQDLRALREGRPFVATCPPQTVSPRDAPPAQRPFP
jgi:hypothetical protein